MWDPLDEDGDSVARSPLVVLLLAKPSRPELAESSSLVDIFGRRVDEWWGLKRRRLSTVLMGQ